MVSDVTCVYFFKNLKIWQHSTHICIFCVLHHNSKTMQPDLTRFHTRGRISEFSIGSFFFKIWQHCTKMYWKTHILLSVSQKLCDQKLLDLISYSHCGSNAWRNGAELGLHTQKERERGRESEGNIGDLVCLFIAIHLCLSSSLY